MRYNCQKCDWSIEGQTQIMTDILEHEKGHEENDFSQNPERQVGRFLTDEKGHEENNE